MGLETRSPTIFRFGIFEVDLRAGELRKQGKRIKLQDQPFQVLTLLLQHPGGVVTREGLRSQLWPADTFVDFDNGLNTSINKLREALGDSADNPRFIETLPRRGYRFIAPVTCANGGRVAILGAGTNILARTPRWMLKAAGLAAAAVLAIGIWKKPWTNYGRGKIASIAVLPLKNLSNDPSQEYFADGMTEELITELSKIGAVRVISRTSAMRYKYSNKPLPEIARELNVDGVIEGSVLRSGDRVRITAQLIHAPSDTHRWAESYERDLQNVLSLQGEVARDIANKIKIRLTPTEQARLSSSGPVDPEAFQSYLKGRFYWNMRTEEGIHKGIEYFREAIAIDPHYAVAYAGLAESYVTLSGYRIVPPKEALPLAKEAALKALAIDEGLAEAHTPLAVVSAEYDLDLTAAEKEFKRSIELDPKLCDGAPVVR